MGDMTRAFFSCSCRLPPLYATFICFTSVICTTIKYLSPLGGTRLCPHHTHITQSRQKKKHWEIDAATGKSTVEGERDGKETWDFLVILLSPDLE